MKTLVTLGLMSVVAFAGGALGALVMIVAGGAMLISTAGLASGGAFDPITATIAVGLGGAALARLRGSATDEPEPALSA